MRGWFGLLFAVVTYLLIGFQISAIDDSHLRFGHLLLLGMLTWCSSIAAAMLLGLESRAVAVSAALLALIVIGFLVSLVSRELEGTKEVWFWEYVFLLAYAMGFTGAAAGAFQQES